MQYVIYDSEGNKQALLQNCTSIQWMPKYYERGSFEIHALPSSDNVTYLVEGNRVVCTDRNEIGFIKYVYSEGNELEVRGYLDNLEDRVNLQTATIKNIESSLLELVTSNKRELDINVAESKGLTPTIKGGSETTYKTLLEDFAEYCQIGGLGWREIVKDGVLNYLEIYQGELKKEAIFSDNLGNIKNQKYEINLQDYKNIAYVYGEDKGTYRKNLKVDIRTSEQERAYEMYVDARDVQSEYKENGEDNTYTDEEYEELLRQRGLNKLAEANKNTYKYSFELDPYSQIAELGNDYDLGDIIVVRSSQYGLIALARITELKFIEESNTDTQISIVTNIESKEVIQ